MARLKSITVNLDPPQMDALSQAAVAAGLTLEQMAATAIEQQLDIALRYHVVLNRLEEMDAHVVALAEFVAEVSAPAEKAQVASICRYRPASGGTPA